MNSRKAAILIVAVATLALAGCGPGIVVHDGPRGMAYGRSHVAYAHPTLDEAQRGPGRDRFPDDYVWYPVVKFPVQEDDVRTDEELLRETIREARGSKREEIERLIERKDGTVHHVAFVVFRGPPPEEYRTRVGSYTSGCILPLADVLDDERPVQELFAQAAIYERPRRSHVRFGWYDPMVIDHFEGRFDHRKPD
jgi:hypothetical protein